jgi:hypothetical protein
MKIIFWKAYVSEERLVSLPKIQHMIHLFGFILDYKLFSDISIAIQIEIDENKIQQLFNILSTYMSIELDESHINNESDRTRMIFLNITFVNGTGNLKIEVPSVDG